MANVSSVIKLEIRTLQLADLVNVLLLHCIYTNNHRHGHITKLTKTSCTAILELPRWLLFRKKTCMVWLLCQQTHEQMQSHGAKRTHAESENEFNVTVQLKASEGATETLVGRWELSRLLTSHCARLMANLSTHTHECKHTNSGCCLGHIHSCVQQHWVTLSPNKCPQTPTRHPHACLKSFLSSAPPPHTHFFPPSFPVVVRCTASETPTSPSPIHYRLHLLASNTDSSIQGGSTATLSTQLCQDGKWFNCLLASKHN